MDQNTNSSDAITFDQVKARARYLRGYVWSKWKIILVIAIIGGAAGLGYALLRKTNYNAICTSVLDTGDKESSLGAYAGLASLAGISLDNGGGLFEGDNILELYKSRSMIEKTLLSTGDFDGKQQSLIERYISFNKLRKDWNDKINTRNVVFTGDPAHFSRTQDSIVTDIANKFNKAYLSVTKPDKKLSIIMVSFKSKDELFAKLFTENIVSTVNTFFVQTKTKKSVENVHVLQHQVDSVRAVLNSSISGVANAIDAAPNANPLLLSLRVPSQKKQVDVQASSAIYSEMVKNLEISKLALNKETPLIQIIDSPVLPLDNDKLSKKTGLAGGFILFAFLTVLYFFFKGFSEPRVAK